MSAMCTKSYEHFTKCDHILSSLSTCPTYRKQQESARRFPGNVLRRGAKKKEDCGKVLPCHLQNDIYCDNCSAQIERLRAKAVGQGALEVRKQGHRDRSHEENKQAARLALQKSDKSGRHGMKVVHAQSSVWLDEAYHQPETSEKKDAYTRKAAPAPSSSRARSRPTNIDTSPRRGTQEPRQGSTDKAESRRELPTYGSSQPMLKQDQLTPAYQYSGRFSNNSPGSRPAVGLPPHPPGGRSPVTSVPSSQPPKLRRKSGHIHNASRSQNQPADAPRQPYLEGKETKAAPRARQPPTAWPTTTSALQPEIGPKPYWEEDRRRKEPGKPRFRLTKNKPKTSDGGSDESFVCETSKRVSAEPIDRPQTTRTRRGPRK